MRLPGTCPDTISTGLTVNKVPMRQYDRCVHGGHEVYMARLSTVPGHVQHWTWPCTVLVMPDPYLVMPDPYLAQPTIPGPVNQSWPSQSVLGPANQPWPSLIIPGQTQPYLARLNLTWPDSINHVWPDVSMSGQTCSIPGQTCSYLARHVLYLGQPCSIPDQTCSIRPGPVLTGLDQS